MPAPQTIRDVFGYFHNLNLLGLIHDLRRNHAAQGIWFDDGLLCPVAHGMPDGARVRTLAGMLQAASLATECDFAARHLGASTRAVVRFVNAWDSGSISFSWLLSQLEELWEERLADADAMQEVLSPGGLLQHAQGSLRHELINP